MVFNTVTFALLASMFTPARAALIFSRAPSDGVVSGMSPADAYLPPPSDKAGGDSYQSGGF